MKKKGLLFGVVLLAAMLLMVFCGCSAYGGIKSAYEKEGYSEFALTEAIKKAFKIDEDEAEGDDKATVHFLTTAKINEDDSEIEIGLKLAGSKFALIWEYKDVETLKKVYEEDLNDEQKADFDQLWEEYQKQPNVNGNCILIMGDQAIFQSAK